MIAIILAMLLSRQRFPYQPPPPGPCGKQICYAAPRPVMNRNGGRL